MLNQGDIVMKIKAKQFTYSKNGTASSVTNIDTLVTLAVRLAREKGMKISKIALPLTQVLMS